MRVYGAVFGLAKSVKVGTGAQGPFLVRVEDVSRGNGDYWLVRRNGAYQFCNPLREHRRRVWGPAAEENSALESTCGMLDGEVLLSLTGRQRSGQVCAVREADDAIKGTIVFNVFFQCCGRLHVANRITGHAKAQIFAIGIHRA